MIRVRLVLVNLNPINDTYKVMTSYGNMDCANEVISQTNMGASLSAWQDEGQDNGLSTTQVLYHLSDEVRVESVQRDLESVEEVLLRVSPSLRWEDETSVLLHSAANALRNHAEILHRNISSTSSLSTFRLCRRKRGYDVIVGPASASPARRVHFAAAFPDAYLPPSVVHDTFAPSTHHETNPSHSSSANDVCSMPTATPAQADWAKSPFSKSCEFTKHGNIHDVSFRRSRRRSSDPCCHSPLSTCRIVG